ncbi:outer membrane beta-barrel protein [Pantanalinema rosaneae CENA516]|uniref:outer membrane beta-barrel protein n=1 Tax=Pantanalinema rosaneae TaxID=1620701 RepID=UPI003D6EFE14
MQLSLNSVKAIAAVSALALTTVSLMANSASAQPMRFSDSYIGAGIAGGVTSGGQGGDDAKFGGNIQGRIGVKEVPVSVRGAVIFSDETAAIVPSVTYDQRISDNANVYAGVGYSFVEKDGKNTPLGNRDSVVLTVGAEAGVVKNVVVYGDAKWGINAYQNSKADSLSFQAGVGYRF